MLGRDKKIVWFRLPDQPVLKTGLIADSVHFWELRQENEITGIHETKL